MHQKSNGKQIWVAEVIEQLCPSMVQDPSATPGSKIGVERQVVIFTRHKLVEYVRNPAPDVMPLQKHEGENHLNTSKIVCPRKAYYSSTYIWSRGNLGHSLFIGTEEVINYLEYCQLNRGKGGSVILYILKRGATPIGVEVFVIVLDEYVLLRSLEYTEPSCHYLIGSTLVFRGCRNFWPYHVKI